MKNNLGECIKQKSLILSIFVISSLIILPSCSLVKISKSSPRPMTAQEKNDLKKKELQQGRERDIQRRSAENAETQKKDVIFAEKLSKARPSADQKVIIDLIEAEKKFVSQISETMTSAATSAKRDKFLAGYANKRLSFAKVCCVNVEKYFDRYNATFYVIDSSAGGNGTGCPLDSDFSMYRITTIHKGNIPPQTALAYKLGGIYQISGKLWPVHKGAAAKPEDLLITSYNSAVTFDWRWKTPEYPSQETYNYSRSREDHLKDKFKDELAASYLGRYFNQHRDIYLDWE